MNQITPIQPVGAMTMDSMIDRYVRLRDKKSAIKDRHKQELAPYEQAMDQLEAWMLETLDRSGLKSAKSPHGTAYKSTRTSAKVTDWAAVLEFIKANDAWDLLEARVSKLAAEQIIAETQLPIPGVETATEIVCNVRRAGDTGTGK